MIDQRESAEGQRRGRRPISKSLPVGLTAFSWISLGFVILVLGVFSWIVR